MSPEDRKKRPIYRGLFKYFPRALMEVSYLSHVGSVQHGHNDIFWDKSKSSDNDDAMLRHCLDRARGEILDSDGVPNSVKVAWRALAVAELELEALERQNEHK